MTRPATDRRTAESTIHATCLVLHEAGVLIRGAPGSGKSALCLGLLDRAGSDRIHARLVADDRVRLSARHGRLIARPHPALAGLIEIRGLGLRRLAQHAEAALVRLVVDLADTRPRLPEDGPDETEILGVRLPLLTLEPRMPREYLILQALAALRPGAVASQPHPATLVPAGPGGV